MPDAQSLSAGPSRPISKIVHDRVSEFSAAWREFVPDNGSKPPDPYDFLPPEPQQRAQAVPLLLEVHIEYHLKAGGTILGHPDFHRFSELRGDPERVLALAEDQYKLLIELKRDDDLEQYLNLFPGQREDLRKRLARFQAVESKLAARGYEILDQIDKGGMGVVYKARQVGLNRLVAVKLMLQAGPRGTPDRDRFDAEAKAVARMQHPNIVQVFDVGEVDGVPFISLEFASGGTLAHKVAKNLLSPREAATLIAKLAAAIHYAHGQGFVHRDIKPQNILFGDRGETKLADFGLAKRVGAIGDSGRTQPGTVVGTPSYMSPEQARADPEQVGPLADVYSLGAVLYELLTGRPPFKAANILSTLEQVRTQEPLAPSRVQPGVPTELETICLKCLEKEPAKRYASAQELTEDLSRWLVGVPVLARPISSFERGWRWCRRNPRVAIPSASALLILVVLAAVAIAFALTKAHDNERLSLAAQDLKDQLHRTDRALADNYADQAQAMCEAGDVPNGLLVMCQGLQQSVKAAAPDLERHFRRDLAWWARETSELRAIVSDPAGMEQVSVSPDGKAVIWISGERAVRIGDPRTGRLRWELAHSAPVKDCVVGADGSSVFTVCGERAAGKDVRPWSVVQQWDIGSGRPRGRALRLDGKLVTHLAVGGDDKKVLVSCDDHSVELRDLETGGRLASAELMPDQVNTVAFSTKGRFALSASNSKLVLWDLHSRAVSRAALAAPAPAYCVLFSPDEKYVIVGGNEGASLWSTDSRRQVGDFLRHKDGAMVFRAAFSPDGETIATAGADSTVRLWRTADQKAQPQSFLLQEAAAGMTFSSTGQVLATATLDGVAQLWDVATGEALTPPLRHADEFRGIEFVEHDLAFMITGANGHTYFRQVPRRANGRTFVRNGSEAFPVLKGEIVTRDGTTAVVLGTTENEARLIDVRSLQPRGSPLVHPITDPKNKPSIRDISFSPDGRFVWTGATDGAVRIWSAATGAAVGSPLPQGGEVSRIVFSPDGGVVAVSAGSAVRIWAADSRELQVALNHGAEVRHVAFSPDGRVLLTGGHDGTGRLWDVSTGQQLCSPLPHPKSVNEGCFHPDGRLVATGCGNPGQRSGGEVRVWEVRTGNPVGPPFVQEISLDGLSWSPDGSLIVAGSGDKTAHVWDPLLGQRVGRPLRHRYFVSDAAFSPDSSLVATGSVGNIDGLGEVRLWDAKLTKPVGPAVFLQDAVLRVTFQDGGSRLIVGSPKFVGIWTLPRVVQGSTERVRASIEVFTGMEMSDAESTRVLQPSEWQDRRRALEEMGGSVLIE